MIALPFAVEYVLMWNTGIITLTRHGAMCPGMVYAVLGLPFVVFLKLWLLLANPFNEAGHTQLSFLGAFDRLDFIVEASVEAPWQTLLNTILFFRDVRLSQIGAHNFPYLLLFSVVTSLYATYEAHALIKKRMYRENVYVESHEELTFFSTVHLMFQAGMGTRYRDWRSYTLLVAPSGTLHPSVRHCRAMIPCLSCVSAATT